MKYPVAGGVIVVLLAILTTGCPTAFGDFDNPKDPKSPNYLAAPQHPSPSNGASVSNAKPLLDWEDVAKATGYRVQVSTTAGFGTTVIDATVGISRYQVASGLSNGTSYYWRVCAGNAAMQWGEWSTGWRFTVNLSVSILQFTSATFTVREDAGSVTITVTRTGGSAGAVGVSYATGDGTATAGSDYTAKTGTLSWGDGDTSAKSFTVNILNDSGYEGNETFTVTLSDPTGGASLGSPSQATVTIEEDDPVPPAGTLQFSSATFTVSEDAGSVTITVTRTGSGSGVVGVTYATGDGTATAGSDYTAKTGTLSWGDGDTSAKSFTVNILNDSSYEGNETFTVTLSDPTGGASLGSPSQATVTIEEDDPPPDEPFISFSPTSFSFNGTVGGANPANQTLSISNGGSGTLSWSVSDNANWLSLSPTSGTSTGETDEVTVSVNIAGLSEGTYDATITITASGATNTPQSVAVALTQVSDTTPLDPPTNVSATDGTSADYVQVTWSSVSGASYYRVYRNTINNCSGATPLGSWQTSLSYNDTSATPGTTYYYWVKAATSSSGERASDCGGPDTGWRALITYSISGTVTLNGSGLSGVTVSTDSSHSATTDSSGSYTITGLMNGSYTVTPSKSGCSFSPTSRSVTVSGANVSGVDFKDVLFNLSDGQLLVVGVPSQSLLVGDMAYYFILDLNLPVTYSYYHVWVYPQDYSPSSYSFGYAPSNTVGPNASQLSRGGFLIDVSTGTLAAAGTVTTWHVQVNYWNGTSWLVYSDYSFNYTVTWN
jgi:hypothetical protein